MVYYVLPRAESLKITTRTLMMWEGLKGWLGGWEGNKDI